MSVAEAIDKARADGRAALIGYWPAGFPTVAGAMAAVQVLVEGGVDAVEVGLPYSDPVLDGRVIAAAGEIALSGGAQPADGQRTVELAARLGVPVLVMTYWNLVEQYRPSTQARNASGATGVRAFATDLAAAGGSGLITPDLIPEEGQPWLEIADQLGLDRVFLVAPSSSDARLAATAAACRGFVYAASVMGVTGPRSQTSVAAPALVDRLRAIIGRRLPVGVGLGVTDGGQAGEVGRYADAVIVGSALVRCVLDASSIQAGLTELRRLTEELAAGVRHSGEQHSGVAIAVDT